MSDTTLRLAPTTAAPRRAVPRLRPALPLSAWSALVMAVFLAGLVLAGSSLLGDPDTQWHIAVGREIWAARAVPTTDLFSHTQAGAPWIAKEWLSQLILSAAYAAGEWRGVVLVTALSIGLAFALLYEWLNRRLKPTLALAIVVAVLPLTETHFLARPHSLVLPVIVAWMIGLSNAVERDRAPPLAFALAMALWANMHGSFPLGLAMAGLMALDGVVAAPRAQRMARCGRWALFLAASLAGTTLSPYGWQTILVPLHVEGVVAIQYIDEWQPLRVDVEGCLALGALVLSLAALARGWRANLFRIVAILLLGAMMVRHGRFVSLFGMLAPIIVAPALARVPGLAAGPAKAPRALWHVAGALAAAALAALAIERPLPSERMAPEAAYRAAVAAGVEGPVLNDYNYGGFLIAHGVKTFVDGRTDQLFLGDFLPNYMRAAKDRDDSAFAAILAKYRIAWALVRTGSAETRHLSHLPGWTEIHADKVATVFVKR